MVDSDLQPTDTAVIITDAPIECNAKQQKIDPWNVAGEVGADGKVKAIDYFKLVDEFGTKRITKEDLERFEKVTGHKPHRFMRRGIVFSHRDLNLILDRYEKGEPFFMYTGRGPSSDSMHIGHTVPFEFTKWLHNVLDVPLIIMLTDDEKYLFGKKTIEEVQSYTAGNAKDIIAVGFDPKKTFMFSDFDFMGGAFYQNTTRMAKHMTLNVVQAVFGFDNSSNVGKFHFAAIQGATSFASSFPHIFGDDASKTNLIPSLIPCAIDQDPYFRLTRDVASRLHFAKPSLIHARFLDALQGPGSKMSASDDKSAVFMKDTPGQIKKKINSFAFSGGQETVTLQRELGGNPDVDVAFQYLNFFMEDDKELERIRAAYKKGEMLTGELKAICIQYLTDYCVGFQERRAAVTDEVVKDFFATKPLECRGLTMAMKRQAAEGPAPEAGNGVPLTKNQLKKLEKEKMIAAKKEAERKEKIKNTSFP